MDASDVRTISVLGAGTMGHGIAEVAATAGYEVTLRDVEEGLVQAGYDRIEESLRRLDEDDDLDEPVEDVLSRIDPVVDLSEAVSGADFVIEAVPERMDVKESVYREIAESLPEPSILATNTSSLSITELGAASDRPTQFVGMHFFNPPVRMRLIEVIRGERTSDQTVETTRTLVESMDKVPVLVRKDSPGFVVNRVLIPLLNEGAWLLEAGDATREVVDATATTGLDLPMGLFELTDYVGVDVVLDVLTYMHAELGAAYEPAPVLGHKVDAGALGRKSGEGFYDYEADGVEIPPEDADADLQLRFVALMANEVAKLVDAGVAPAEDVDRAMELGAGFPAGPAVMADEYGVERLLEVLERLHDRTGDARYEPAPLLERLAAEGASLRSAP